MQVKLISAQGIMLDEQADAVVLRGMEGTLTILPHHADIIVCLRPGDVQICQGAQRRRITLAGGYAYMHDEVLAIVEKRRRRMEEKREFRHRARGSSDAFFTLFRG